MSPQDLVVTPQGCRFMGRMFPCALGRGGITTDKREGDGATPAGSHRITSILYRPDRIAGSALPEIARPIGPRDLWCDDPDHKDYNQQTRAPFNARHERLSRADPLYDLILLTDWNWPRALPGRGSAIFVHTWRAPGYPTAGCVAFRLDHLIWIANHIGAGTRLHVPPLNSFCLKYPRGERTLGG